VDQDLPKVAKSGEEEPPLAGRRIFGLQKGKIRILDGFDDPLPEMLWIDLGDESAEEVAE